MLVFATTREYSSDTPEGTAVKEDVVEETRDEIMDHVGLGGTAVVGRKKLVPVERQRLFRSARNQVPIDLVAWAIADTMTSPRGNNIGKRIVRSNV